VAKRRIVRIDVGKCTGCGECIPDCPEGALQLLDGKARLAGDLFCDGLGACIGSCPEDAIKMEEREAEPHDEKKVMENIVPRGPNTIRAHLKHLKEHGAGDYYAQAVGFLKEHHVPVPALEAGQGDLPCGCPGTHVMDLSEEGEKVCTEEDPPAYGSRPHSNLSRLRQWPVQLALVPPTAPYLSGAELLMAADCVPFAYAGFHEEFLKGRALLVGCPKLDDHDSYEKKLTTILEQNDFRSVTVVHMEVPCCLGLVTLAKAAIKASRKAVPFADTTVSVKGKVLSPA
jgi:ferredoxin